MNGVEDLDFFKLAHDLALNIYSVTKSSPGKKPTAWLTGCAGRQSQWA